MGLGRGISYVARIREPPVVLERGEVRGYLKGRVADDRTATSLVLGEHRSGDLWMVLLNQPYQLFNAPVSKDQLNLGTDKKFGKGALGARTVTVEDLVRASKATALRAD